eukprot:189465_1
MSALGASHDQQSRMLLNQMGFDDTEKITGTLQGSIWRAKTNPNPNKPSLSSSVVKVTDRSMHKQKIAVYHGNVHQVDEDIVLEQAILRYLTQSETCPPSIVKFKRFIQSETDYALEMEDGGSSLFSFVTKAHQLLQSGSMDHDHWHQIVKIIFKQMVESVSYIHSKNVCHFDISLENFLISDPQIEVHEKCNGRQTKIKFIADSIQVKLCDFGLAQLFTNDDCKSSKFCGKTNYKSPECTSETRGYDAKKNDVWCCGVSLFMMMLGTAPWHAAKSTDTAFQYIMSGKLITLLISWNLLHYVNRDFIDLMDSIFQYESDRVCLSQIKQHPWIRH